MYECSQGVSEAPQLDIQVRVDACLVQHQWGKQLRLRNRHLRPGADWEVVLISNLGGGGGGQDRWLGTAV